MHFVSFHSVAGMYLLLAKCIQMVIRTPKNAFRQHSNCIQNAFVGTKNEFREHSNCTQNAFVSESDWQANAFKWSFGSI